MPEINLKNICLGGISDSEYIGNKNQVAELVGFDIHSEPGILKSSALFEELPLVFRYGGVDENVIGMNLPLSDGFFFLSKDTGRVWRLDESDDTMSYVCTDTLPYESWTVFGTYLILVAYNKIHRILLTTIASSMEWKNEAGWNWKTLSDSNAHPILQQNGKVYIGDGTKLVEIDSAGNYNADVLNGSLTGDILCIKESGSNIILGLSDYKIVTWNGYSEAPSYSDKTVGDRLSLFIPVDNAVVALSNETANLYTCDGERANFLRQIRADRDATVKTIASYHRSTLDFGGIPYFALYNDGGDKIVLPGLYSFARKNSSYPYVLNHDYPIIESGEFLENSVIIDSVFGTYSLYYIYHKTSGTDQTSHVMKRNEAKLMSGSYLKTLIYPISNSDNLNLGKIEVGYRALPTGTSIKMYASKNYGAFSQITVVVDAKNNLVTGKVNVGKCRTLQVIIETAGYVNKAPEIDMININI